MEAKLIWDEDKRIANLSKHGLDFSDAGGVRSAFVMVLMADLVKLRDGLERKLLKLQGGHVAGWLDQTPSSKLTKKWSRALMSLGNQILRHAGRFTLTDFDHAPIDFDD